MDKLRFFPDPNLGGMARLTNRRARESGLEDWLGVGEKGKVEITEGIEALGFYLAILVPKISGREVIINQRVIKEGNMDYQKYNSYCSLTLKIPGADGVILEIAEPVNVRRVGGNTWTVWKRGAEVPNRADCWLLGGNHLSLFQIGVVHRKGIGFILLGDYAWKGELYRRPLNGGEIVGKPEEPYWGTFEIRRNILETFDFKRLLEKNPPPLWERNDGELNPALSSIPEGYARVNWFNPFGGQTGYGYAILSDGKSIAIHGEDVLDTTPDDGVQRLKREVLLSYRGIELFGSEQKPKLVGVKKVSET